MKNLPYFRWYPADAETDDGYASMTDAELGFYHRCLNRSWINEGLPADLKELARRMGVTGPYLKKVWASVGLRFQLSEATGRLVNPRQERERSQAIGKSEKAANAARLSHADGVRSHLHSQERSQDFSSAFAGSIAEPRALARPDSVSVFVSEVLEKKDDDEMRPEWDEQWQEFMRLFAANKSDTIPEDFTIGWHAWKTMDFYCKNAAIDAVKARTTAGEVIWCAPKQFLRSEYKRPPKPLKKQLSRAEQVLAERTESDY